MKTSLLPASWPMVFLAGIFWAHVLAAPSFGQDQDIDSVMYAGANRPVATVEKVCPQRLTSLWLQALERPENDLKLQAAAAIGLAQRRGMSGLQSTVTPLLHTFDQPDQNASVRLAVAEALIAL